jgi:hypothetical protein
MSGLNIFGGSVFNNQQFKDHMNSHYHPLENMQKSVDKLKASDQIDIATLEYGQYQAILSPLDIWPGGRGKFWMKEMGFARLQLTAQPNNLQLSRDEPGVVPLTRCALLDASLRKCFNSQPPIPMLIDVTQKQEGAPNPDQHDIKLVWEYGQDGTDKVPSLLRFTMICPYIRPKS